MGRRIEVHRARQEPLDAREAVPALTAGLGVEEVVRKGTSVVLGKPEADEVAEDLFRPHFTKSLRTRAAFPSAASSYL
jgi:hypothetical protein